MRKEIRKYELTGTGTSPLLMHNGRMSDPLDPAAKALGSLTSKQKKTDEDLYKIADIEWSGALYYDEVAGPYVPGENIWRALYDAAGQQKARPRVKVGLRVLDAVNPIAYDGPRDEATLRSLPAYRLRTGISTGINRRVQRTRPLFAEWTFVTTLMVDEAKLNPADVARMCAIAGDQVGLGDWRPKYGTFRAVLREIG